MNSQSLVRFCWSVSKLSKRQRESLLYRLIGFLASTEDAGKLMDLLHAEELEVGEKGAK